MKNDIYFETELPDGAPCVIIMRSKTVYRLAKTCFRGGALCRAGNFAIWNNFREMLEDDSFRSTIVADMLERVEASGDKLVTENCRLSFHGERLFVGWSSTTSPDHWDNNILLGTEVFHPNRHSTACRVQLHRRDIKAPPTGWVTLVYELKFERGTGWVAVVHTVYPGEDIGDLRGNITQDQGVIFFDFDHPGQPVRR